MPPDPTRGSRLLRSYLITPFNKYSCQYEHPSKNLSYGAGTVTRIFNVKPYFEIKTHSFKFAKHVSRSRTYLVPKMPFLNYHDPVLFKIFLAQPVAPVMSARQTDLLLHVFVNI